MHFIQQFAKLATARGSLYTYGILYMYVILTKMSEQIYFRSILHVNLSCYILCNIVDTTLVVT